MSQYTYNAVVERVVDGDTLDLAVDLGFKVQVRERFRLFGIDTPEVFGKSKSPEGEAASAYLKALLPVGTRVLVETVKGTEKYGRWLAMVYLPDSKTPVNTMLIDAGHAKTYIP
jgi:micrococcal nuclease